MRLANFSVRNFKSIGDAAATVRLAPITLLFGPNGAGKSSLLHALHYAREVVEHANLDADVTRTGGSLDLGGFANFVHGRNLDREIVLSFDIDLENDGLPGAPKFGFDGGFGASINADAIRSLDEVSQVRVELTIRWSQILGRPYISRYASGLDGDTFAAIEASADLKTVEVTDLSALHPYLNAIPAELRQAEDEYGAVPPDGLDFLELFYRAPGAGQREPVESTRVGALPPLDTRLVFPHSATLAAEMRPSEEKSIGHVMQEIFEILALDAYVSRVLSGSLVALRDALSALVHIGPLRALPPRGYLPQRTFDPGRWHSGMAAWDRLHHDDGSLTLATNDWLDEKLKSGFGLRVSEGRWLPAGSAVDAALLTPDYYYDDELRAAGDALFGQLVDRRIVLTDTTRFLDVTPHDVGVGISQLLPVIVAALAPENRLVAIEQPELHIHPRLQTQLGDLFIAAIEPPLAGTPEGATPKTGNGRALLVETHSEHLLLRLLRRIRHTDLGDLEPGAPLVTPSLVAVHYANPGANGLEVCELRISRDGDFLDEWPDGFFEERGTELFS